MEVCKCGSTTVLKSRVYSIDFDGQPNSCQIIAFGDNSDEAKLVCAECKQEIDPSYLIETACMENYNSCSDVVKKMTHEFGKPQGIDTDELAALADEMIEYATAIKSICYADVEEMVATFLKS